MEVYDPSFVTSQNGSIILFYLYFQCIHYRFINYILYHPTPSTFLFDHRVFNAIEDMKTLSHLISMFFFFKMDLIVFV